MILILAAAVLLPLTSINANRPSLSDLNTQRQSLQRSINEARNSLSATQRELNVAEREIEALDMQIMDVLYDMVILSDSLDLVEERLEQAIIDLELAREYHATQEAVVHLRLRELHERGQLTIFDVLVQSNSVRDFMLQMEFMARVASHDQQMLQRLADAELLYLASVEDEDRLRTNLENALSELDRLAEELEELLDEWEARYEELIVNQLSYEELIAAYQAQERTVAQQIADEQRRQEIERERLRQANEARLLANLQLGSGRAWPVPGFHNITSDFGMRPNPFNRRVMEMHHGIDIASAGINGAPVVAAADGVVTRASIGWNGGFGNVVMVLHGGGFTTVYAHLSRIQVREGQVVLAGETIGNVGTTGNSTGPHLHFEVRQGSARINPWPFLRGEV